MSIPTHVLQPGLATLDPLYVYDLAALERRFAALESIPIPGKAIFFATMANDHPEVLAHIERLGHGVFVNSRKHLDLALRLGFPPERIVYAASNMDEIELRKCFETRVHLVLDSLGQLRSYATLAGAGSAVGLRLNVGSVLDGQQFKNDPEYRFGLLQGEISEALKIASLSGLRITGIHSYFGTDILDPKLLLAGVRRLAALAERFPHLEYIDLAGGLGVGEGAENHEFNLGSYGQSVRQVLSEQERRIGRPLQAWLEPGRYLAASCGFFFVTVIDVKIRPDRVFVGTNGSVSIFPRPLIYPDRARHPCELIAPAGQREMSSKPVYVCGNSTYSRDFLARDIQLQMPRIGDRLAFHQAGAYCRSMITSFLGKDAPSEVVCRTACGIGAETRRVAEIPAHG